MKKLFLMAGALLLALNIVAGDKQQQQVPMKIGQKQVKEQPVLTARGLIGWGSAVGRCNVRKGPGTNYGVAFVIYDGQGFRVLSQRGQWYRIKMGFHGGGRIGWTHEQNINWCEDPDGTGI